jgi:hypothetical protein
MDSHIALTGSYEDRPGGSVAWSGMTPVNVEDLAFDENPWAWADYVDDSAERVDVSAAHVTAVLVTFDAARWLPSTLEALAKLDTPPTRLIAIDNASTDATPALLHRAYEQGVLDAIYQGDRAFGFGAAVQTALESDAANLQDDADTIGFRAVSAHDTHWLWLLHDDAVPAPDALYQLLAHVTSDQGAGTAPSRSVRLVSASLAPVVASLILMWMRSTRASGISRRSGSGFRPAACWSAPPYGSILVASTRRCRFSETASSLAGGPI